MTQIRRLRDLSGIPELERRALLDVGYRAASADVHDPRFDEVSTALFGMTRAEAEEFLDSEFEIVWGDEEGSWKSPPNGMAGVDEDPRLFCDGSDAELVATFNRLGWDVTDEHGRPLYTLPHFKLQLMTAITGKRGHLPPAGEDVKSWADRFEADARRFKRTK